MWNVRRFWGALLSLGLFESGLIGCSDSTVSAPVQTCHSDEAIACITDSACHGYKHCNSDGKGYGACDCSLSNGGATGNTSVSSADTSRAGNGGAASSSFGLGGATTSRSAPAGASAAGNTNTSGGVPSLGGNSGSSSTSSAGTSNANTRRAKVCDPDRQNCKCLNLASFGQRASNAYGEGTDGKPTSTTAFETWLTEKTNANVWMVQTKPNLDAEYLANFDVIILQDLRTWTLSNDEQQHLANWVSAGGGLIALSGYENTDDAEVIAANQVLAFTGMSYEGGATEGSIPGGICPDSSRQLCPQSTAACCYCWNSTIPIRDFTPNHPVTKGIQAMGAFYGRAIDAGNATVLATFTPSGAATPRTVAATKPVGLGEVVLWCDEWITYTSQWAGGITSPGLTPDQLKFYPCYDATLGHWLTADNVFQTKQFWYNLIAHVAPPTECSFVVNEPDVAVF